MVAHGFPANLLPDCIAGDQYHEGTGVFTVSLARKVDLNVDGIPVHYAKSISGIIKQGTITKLKGVKAKKGFWIGISAIHVKGADLVFHVGVITRAVPLSAFVA
jgi:hypothetical protein